MKFVQKNDRGPIFPNTAQASQVRICYMALCLSVLKNKNAPEVTIFTETYGHCPYTSVAES